MWKRILYTDPIMHAFVADPENLQDLLADAETETEIKRSLATCFPDAYSEADDKEGIRNALALNDMVTVVVASGPGAPYKGTTQMCTTVPGSPSATQRKRVAKIGSVYILASVNFAIDLDGSEVAYLWNVCKNSTAAGGLPYVTSALFQAIAMYIRDARPHVVAMGLNIDTKSPTVSHAIKSYTRHGFGFSSKKPLGIPYYASLAEPNRYKRMDLPL